MLTFPNIKKFAWNSAKNQSWNTTTQRSASGRVRTLTNQTLPLWKISVSCPAITDDEARVIFAFFTQVKGSFEPFYWLDAEDYKCTNQRLASIGNGKYQAVMVQGGYTEAVDRIENVNIYVNGAKQASSNYTVSGGVVTFKTAPIDSAIITADYTYYWRLFFESDSLKIEKVFRDINKVSFSMVIAR